VVVYGPAQDEHKEKFLAELVNMFSHENLPLVVRGGGVITIFYDTRRKRITITTTLDSFLVQCCYRWAKPEGIADVW
jgi:hypothetical protein